MYAFICITQLWTTAWKVCTGACHKKVPHSKIHSYQYSFDLKKKNKTGFKNRRPDFLSLIPCDLGQIWELQMSWGQTKTWEIRLDLKSQIQQLLTVGLQARYLSYLSLSSSPQWARYHYHLARWLLEVEILCQLESIKEDKRELHGMNCLKWDNMPLLNACISNSGLILKDPERCVKLWFHHGAHSCGSLPSAQKFSNRHLLTITWCNNL